MKFYVAGPMRGYKNFNFDAFDSAANDLRAMGHVAISPTDLDRVHEGWVDYPPDDLVVDGDLKRRCITRDLMAIMECDALYMLPGWENSLGAIAEHSLATFLGLEIYEEKNPIAPIIRAFDVDDDAIYGGRELSIGGTD